MPSCPPPRDRQLLLLPFSQKYLGSGRRIFCLFLEVDMVWFFSSSIVPGSEGVCFLFPSSWRIPFIWEKDSWMFMVFCACQLSTANFFLHIWTTEGYDAWFAPSLSPKHPVEACGEDLVIPNWCCSSRWPLGINYHFIWFFLPAFVTVTSFSHASSKVKLLVCPLSSERGLLCFGIFLTAFQPDNLMLSSSRENIYFCF